jgi:transposase-like protein
MLDTPAHAVGLSVAEQRYRAVLEVGAGVPVTEVAERYGVSRQSVHTWLRRSGSGEAENRSPSGRFQQSLVTSNCVSDIGSQGGSGHAASLLDA